jgi:hypothetical protein
VRQVGHLSELHISGRIAWLFHVQKGENNIFVIFWEFYLEERYVIEFGLVLLCTINMSAERRVGLW